MEVTIIKPCDVRLKGVVRSLQAWTRLNLPADKAKKLIDAGYAESCLPTSEAFQKLLSYFSENDPADGCWQWVQKHLPELWKKHQEAMRSGNLATARESFNAMVTAWNSRCDPQPELMVA